MSDKIVLILTEDQHQVLAPLLKQVSAAARAGKKGAIIGQFRAFTAHVGFVPYKYAKRMRKIVKEMEEKDVKSLLP